MAFDAGAVVIRVLPDMRSFEAAVHGSTRRLGQRIGAVGSSFTRGLTIPLVAAGAASVKLAVDFETAMGKIQGLVGVSQKQTKQWGQDILKLARDLPQGPQELAESLYFVASSGIAVGDALGVVKEAAQASAAGLGSTIDVADLLTSAVNVFGIETLSAAEAADVLVAAVREGKGEADEYAEALGRVLPVADLLGVTFDQTAAAASALTLGGLDIYESVTALRQTFNAFVKPSAAGRKELLKLGTSIEKVRVNLKKKGLIDTLIELRARLVNAGFGEVFEEIEKNGVGSLTELRDKFGENADALGKIFPNIRGLVGFLSLTGDNVKHNKELFDDLADSVGDSDKAFKVVSETTEFKMKKALSSLKATAIQFGQLLLPVVQAVASFFGGIADFLGGISENGRKTILIFAGIAAAIGPILMLVGKLLTFNKWFLLIAAAATFIIQNWKEIWKVIGPTVMNIKNIVVSTWKRIQAAVGPVIDRIREMIPTLKQVREWFVKAFAYAGEIAAKVGAALMKYVWPVLKGIWDVAVGLFNFFKDDVMRIWEALVQFIVGSLWPALKDLGMAFLNLWEFIKPVAKIIGAIIVIIIKLALMIIPELLAAFGWVIRIIAKVIHWVSVIIGWFGRLIGAVISVAKKIGHWFAAAWDAVKSAWNGAVGFFKRIWWAIESGLVAAANAIAGSFEWMINMVITGLNFLIRNFNKIPLFPDISEIDKVNFTTFRVSFDNFVGSTDRSGGVDKGEGRGSKGATGPQPLATGGIVTRPTLAMIGEKGPEAVIPLKRLGAGSEVYEMRITNWESGQGYVRKLARSEVDDDNEYQERVGRFRRAQ